MKNNLKNHWDEVKSGWRHIVSDMTNDKKERLVSNFNQYFIKNIDSTKIKSSLDWGCGGGLLTKELKKLGETYVVDISSDSLNECEKFAKPDYKKLIPSNIEDFKWDVKNVDFILCHALVWHFPTLEYFKEVISIWNDLNPNYIAFNIKTIEDSYEETNSYSENFLHALKLSDSLTEELMNEIGYSVNSKELVTTGRQPQTYYTFKKS